MKRISIVLLAIFLLLVIGVVCCFVFFYHANEINVYDYYSGEQREEVKNSDIIYLWNEDNMPTETTYVENNGNYFDDPDFRPYMTVYEVPEDVEIKGAVLVSPGGAFMFRSEIQEGSNVAEEFAKRGYVAFVVHYRVRPFTEEESGIDIARAIKYVRYHAQDYGIPTDNISVVGFSAGGIANGHAVLEFGDTVNGTVIDSSYVPDDIDSVSSTPNAIVMGYAFYGRLSVADLNASTFQDITLPPTYYVYGTRDPFYNQFNRQVHLLEELNKDIEVQVLDNYPHGFGASGDWIDDVCNWLEG